MWAYGPKKSPKMVLFGINFPRRGISLKSFLQNFAWGREPQDRTRMPNFTVVAWKMWPYGSKNRQKWQFFCKKFAPREKILGSIGKLEHRCTTTKLPLCNDTIIVLKLKLLHSVSVITNFVIPKRDKKQADKKKTSHFFVYSRRATHDPLHTSHGDTDRRGPSHFCTP